MEQADAHTREPAEPYGTPPAVRHGLEVYRKGVRVVRSYPVRPARNSARRGLCKGYNPQVRLRVAWWLLNSEIGAIAKSFAVLTYPATWAPDWRTWKRHIDILSKRLRRRGVQGAWFMEFQKRGAPHFNILLGDGVEVAELCRWWHALVGNGDEAHAFGLGFYMEPIKDWEKICGYLVAELSKRQQKTVPAGFENGVGRWWGKWGIAKLRPLYTLKGQLAINAARVARKGVNSDRRARCWAHQRNFGDGEVGWNDPSVKEFQRVTRKIFKRGGKIPNLARFMEQGYRKVRDNGKASRRIWDGAKWCKMLAPPPGVPGASGAAPGAGASP